MIIDHLSAAEKYYNIHPLFEKAFGYLNTLDLLGEENGRHDLPDEGLFYLVFDRPGVTAETALESFECHDRHIDIQLCVRGNETIGWKPRAACTKQKEFNEQADYRFYEEAPDMFFQLTDLQFAIFFPGDVHAPMISDETIRKIVVKVKL